MTRPDRSIRLWAQVLRRAGDAPVEAGHVAAVAAAVAGVDAAAITVVLAASPRENLYASNAMAADMEELTTTLGEGPGCEALAGDPALSADLAESTEQRRWPFFAPAAVAAGVRAAFALPLRVGGIRLGVLDLYRAGPGPLDADRLGEALLLADTACALLLDASVRPGADPPQGVGLQHPEVHQATGMIIAQAGLSPASALFRLRAYAYARDHRLRDVAARVVARRLHFHPGDGEVEELDTE
jgi:hypothetical protein